MLKELGASEFGHINGTLLEHLMGTRALLEQWHAPRHLQYAGLFHAAYSTAGFQEQLLDVDQRKKVTKIIGQQAEEIVYLYCACDREKFYGALETNSSPEFPDRFTGTAKNLSANSLKDLCELTVANEIEIASNNPKFKRKHGASRYLIYSGMFPNLSASARAAVETVFGAVAD